MESVNSKTWGDFGVTGVYYTAAAARNVLTTTYSWEINDAGQAADISDPSITITSSTVSSGASSSDASITLIFTPSEVHLILHKLILQLLMDLYQVSIKHHQKYIQQLTQQLQDKQLSMYANTFTDYAGNNNTAATQFTWTYTGESSDPTETDPTEKADVKTSVIVMSHIVTNFAKLIKQSSKIDRNGYQDKR